MACVGDFSAANELKILHLCQYLRGDALKTIDALVVTASAYRYSAALGRFEHKYGSDKQQIVLQLEAVNKFPLVSILTKLLFLLSSVVV